VFERTENFVDFTLYFNGYYDFIGNNLLLCPNNRIFFLKNDTIREIKWLNFFLRKNNIFFKKPAILNHDFNITVILQNHNVSK